MAAGFVLIRYSQVYRHLLFNRLGRDDDELDVSIFFFKTATLGRNSSLRRKAADICPITAFNHPARDSPTIV